MRDCHCHLHAAAISTGRNWAFGLTVRHSSEHAPTQAPPGQQLPVAGPVSHVPSSVAGVCVYVHSWNVGVDVNYLFESMQAQHSGASPSAPYGYAAMQRLVTFSLCLVGKGAK